MCYPCHEEWNSKTFTFVNTNKNASTLLFEDHTLRHAATANILLSLNKFQLFSLTKSFRDIMFEWNVKEILAERKTKGRRQQRLSRVQAVLLKSAEDAPEVIFVFRQTLPFLVFQAQLVACVRLLLSPAGVCCISASSEQPKQRTLTCLLYGEACSLEIRCSCSIIGTVKGWYHLSSQPDELSTIE